MSWLVDFNLILFNADFSIPTFQETFKDGIRESFIDLTIGNMLASTTIQDWRIESSLGLTDHNFIHFNIESNCKVNELNASTRRYNIKKADLDSRSVECKTEGIL